MAEKLWIYTISRELQENELKDFSERCRHFVNNWTAHEQQLKASFEIYKNRILIIKVDESVYNASGCSIDKQVKFIKEMEKEFNVELLNRMLVAYEDAGQVKVVSASNVKSLLHSGEMNENTPVFDNTITSSTEMVNWRKPLQHTWLSKYLPGVSS